MIIKKITLKTIFKLNHKLLGKILKKDQLFKGNHPPKNSIETKAPIKSILAYSPKKNRAKVIAEYSTLYPDTNSASASGRSKG